MATPSGFEALAELVFLVLAAVPLGIVLLRGLERFVGHRWDLSPFERVIVAFYASGGLLFVLASVPLPLFFPWVVPALFAVGAVAYAAISIGEHESGIRHFVAWLRTLPALTVAAATVGLLILYIWTIGSLPFGNGLDGAFHSLVTTLLLQNHTIPWTLRPYEASGVEYPMGAAVWEALPVILYGWPVVSSPVILPALFLSFTPAAAYCWGERIGGLATPAGSRMGLLFAGFFGLLASWPRLFVGGSYDFAFALPIFLVVLGWLPDFERNPRRPWREVVAVGLLIGTTAVVSGMIGLELVLLLGGIGIVRLVRHPREFGPLIVRFAGVLAIGVCFLARSFLGLILWFRYPGNILSAAGSPPFVRVASPALPPYRFATGEIDPFVLWKYKLSPIPYLSLELMLLLAGGLGLVGLWLWHPNGKVGRHLPAPLVRTVILGTVVTFVAVSFLVLANYVGGPLAPVLSITYIEEVSILLFIFYEGIALLPLVASLDYLEHHRASPTVSRPAVASSPAHVLRPRNSWVKRSVASPWVTVLALVVVAQPLAIGAVASGTSVPSFLLSHVEEFANVTDADVTVLDWAGSHLPSCSRVLVAPGSAARYLPEFASVHLISYEGYAWNLSYNRAVADLSDGVYNGSTRVDLLQIQVTDVFVTGQTSVTFLPFLPGPLEQSSDFNLLFHVGDAYIFSFEPGSLVAGCPSP